jgi:hypothetical protein
MDDLERYRRRAKARHIALARQGASNIYCLCGESDPICFDAEHIYRRELDGTVWGRCSNCHRKKSMREQTEHPPVGQFGGHPFERMAHRNLGMALYLEFCVEGLRKDADSMLKLAERGVDFEV